VNKQFPYLHRYIPRAYLSISVFQSYVCKMFTWNILISGMVSGRAGVITHAALPLLDEAIDTGAAAAATASNTTCHSRRQPTTHNTWAASGTRGATNVVSDFLVFGQAI
jgi:hypothetical protein